MSFLASEGFAQGFGCGFGLMSIAAFLVIRFVKPDLSTFSSDQLRAALQSKEGE